MMKPSRSSAYTWRYIAAAILGGLGLFFAWKLLVQGDGSEYCPLPKTAYNLVKVYKGDGTKDLTMFVFNNDELSQQVLAHSAHKVRVAKVKSDR